MTRIMNKPIDPRNMLTGIFLGVLVVLCLGAALRHGNQPGRFQLGVGDGQTAYVIDTASGQVWEKQDLNQKEFFAPKGFSPKSANDFTEREMKELGQRMVQVAKARYETGRIASAEQILQATLEIDPGSQAALYYMGLVQEAVQANKNHIREWYPTNPPRPVHQ
jgi:hypothetical protein